MVETACKTMIKMQDSHGGALEHMTKHMSLDVAIVRTATNAHFITSDRPCLISPMLKPGGMVCMPVAQDVIVQLSKPEESLGDLHSLSPEKVHHHNRQTMLTATRFVAGPSKEYLEQLAAKS